MTLFRKQFVPATASEAAKRPFALKQYRFQLGNMALPSLKAVPDVLFTLAWRQGSCVLPIGISCARQQDGQGPEQQPVPPENSCRFG